MIPYFITESKKDYSLTVMEVIVKDRKLVVPHKSLEKFILEGLLESISQKNYYDFDKAKKYIEKNELLIQYQNYLDEAMDYLDEASAVDRKLYENFDFIEMDDIHYVRVNYFNKWFEIL